MTQTTTTSWTATIEQLATGRRFKQMFRAISLDAAAQAARDELARVGRGHEFALVGVALGTA